MRALIVLLLAAVASAKLAPLYTHTENIPGRYIVKLKPGESPDAIISTLDDVKVFYKYKTVFPGFAAQLTDRMVQILRKSDAVEYIEEDSTARINAVGSWGLDRVDQLSLPLDDTFTPIGDGNGVDVYVLDTGINVDHEDFGGRAFLGYDALGGTGDDCNGHGSHCAGTIAGDLYGVAKAVNVYAVRVLGCTGSGSVAGIVDGCEWVVNNHDGPTVASMSIGGGVSQSFDDAIQNMVDAGITIAVSAGNSNTDACNQSPARATSAITVGATDSSDIRASFSNYGYCVDIFAPGVDITSAWIGGTDATNTISGTSMSCPHVAGAAAVLLGLDFTLTPQQLKTSLQLKSIVDVVQDPQVGSPNLLLYIGEGSGGGFIPEPFDPNAGHPDCSGTFNDTTGIFTSPNYPADYPNDKKCDFLFAGTASDVVTVTFDSFSLEPSTSCIYDSVTIYDGADLSALVLGVHCGTDNPGTVTSTGRNMFIQFLSDVSVTSTGFSATYTIEIPPETGDCGHTFTEETGVMTSPNFPSKYGNNEDCSFYITAESGKTITLLFTAFELEMHTTCAYDGVEVSDIPNGNPLGKVCGEDMPDAITSPSNTMYFRFTSDSSVTRTGFSAQYSVQ